MGDIAQRGNRLTAAKGGRAALRFGGGRTNLLEQLGRVEGERSNPNRRAEISRVHGELNRGYKTGGRAGFSTGSKKVDITTEKFKKYYEGKPGIPKEPKKRKKYQEHWDKAEKNKQKRLAIEAMKPEDAGYATGGRIGFKKGTDKRWIQKATASIKRRKTKGKCTPITKPGCTGRAKALAKTFKKIAAKRKA